MTCAPTDAVDEAISAIILAERTEARDGRGRRCAHAAARAASMWRQRATSIPDAFSWPSLKSAPFTENPGPLEREARIHVCHGRALSLSSGQLSRRRVGRYSYGERAGAVAPAAAPAGIRRAGR